MSDDKRKQLGRRVTDNVIHLKQVPDLVSYDTVSVLTTLLEEARRGQVIGLAVISILPRLDYQYGFAGVALNYPVMVKGMVVDLLEELKQGVI